MLFEEAFVQLVKSRPAIVAAVPNAGSRVWLHPNRIPQGASKPAISYQVIDAPQVGKRVSGSNALTRARVQLTIWDQSYLNVSRVAAGILKSGNPRADEGGLAGYRGVVGDVSIAITIDDSARDQFEPDSTNNQRFIDVFVYHNAS
jgi:hypothetical protein